MGDIVKWELGNEGLVGKIVADGADTVWSISSNKNHPFLLTSTPAGIKLWEVPEGRDLKYANSFNYNLHGQKKDTPTALKWIGDSEFCAGFSSSSSIAIFSIHDSVIRGIIKEKGSYNLKGGFNS